MEFYAWVKPLSRRMQAATTLRVNRNALQRFEDAVPKEEKISSDKIEIDLFSKKKKKSVACYLNSSGNK